VITRDRIAALSIQTLNRYIRHPQFDRGSIFFALGRVTFSLLPALTRRRILMNGPHERKISI
jgi:hypothetical protein